VNWPGTLVSLLLMSSTLLQCLHM